MGRAITFGRLGKADDGTVQFKGIKKLDEPKVGEMSLIDRMVG